MLESLDAAPRLGAHLRAVHDVACELVDWVATNYGGVEVDREAVLFGAATHDIGKVVHPEELSGPGSAHEQDGYQLLIERGVSEELARFARTHASWTESGVGLGDLLVSLADKIWKGKRVPELEQLVVQRLAAASGEEPWQVFMSMDDELTRITATPISGSPSKPTTRSPLEITSEPPSSRRRISDFSSGVTSIGSTAGTAAGGAHDAS